MTSYSKYKTTNAYTAFSSDGNTDTIGNCQRPVFSLGVARHTHKITNM